VIDEMLRADLDAPRKQRHTAQRIADRRVSEHDAVGVHPGTGGAGVASAERNPRGDARVCCERRASAISSGFKPVRSAEQERRLPDAVKSEK